MSQRCLILAMLCGALGCGQKVDLPALEVSAATKENLTRFRAELDPRFPAERLKDFDTAIQELELDAMSRNLQTVEARQADMLRAANGKTVHAVTVLGWSARRARFLREIAEITRMLEHDLRQPETDAVLRRIGSEREVLARLQQNLADTERRLAELGPS